MSSFGNPMRFGSKKESFSELFGDEEETSFPEPKISKKKEPERKKLSGQSIFEELIERKKGGPDTIKENLNKLTNRQVARLFVLWKRTHTDSNEIRVDFTFDGMSEEDTAKAIAKNREEVLEIFSVLGASQWGPVEIAVQEVFHDLQLAVVTAFSKTDDNTPPKILGVFKNLFKSKAWGIGLSEREYKVLLKYVKEGVCFSHNLIIRNYLASNQGAQGVALYNSAIPAPDSEEVKERKRKFFTYWATRIPIGERPERTKKLHGLQNVGFEVFYPDFKKE